MALMKISEYRERYFTARSAPSPNTVKKWVREGIIYGTQIGSQWYVDPDRQIVPAANELVLKVMSDGA